MDDQLQKAPLIEAIFEFRWQPVVADRNEGLPSRVHSYDLSAFPFSLSRKLQSQGYTTVEHVLPEFAPPTLHQVRTRYRRENDLWPCLQMGDGIFTVNQINDGYTWDTFRRDLLAALAIFFESRDSSFPFSGVQLSLRYIDGLPTNSFSDFLADQTYINAQVGEEMRKALIGPVALDCRSVSFAGELSEPVGSSVEISAMPHPNINGQPGAYLTYRVSGELKEGGVADLADAIDTWIEPAHQALHSLFENTFTAEVFRSFR